MESIRMRKFMALILLISIPFACSKDDEVSAGIDLNLDIELILGLINQNRKDGAICGNDNMSAVSSLQWSDELAKAALDHSNDMQQNDYFDHTSQDGRKFSERAKAAGFEGSPLGENIAGGYPTEEAVMEGWMDSPGHCKNIMNTGATHVGVAKSAEGAVWTMVLGKV